MTSYDYGNIVNERTSPYKAIPSAKATKINALPMMLESSLIAPRAALAADATAIPPPIQERPVERAAAMYLHPSPEEEATASVAADALPVNIIMFANTKVPKKKNTLKPRAALKPPFFFLLNKNAPNGIKILKSNAATKIYLVTKFIMMPPKIKNVSDLVAK